MNSNSFNNDDESPADESTRVDTSRHHRNVEAGDAPSRIGRYEVKAVLGRGAFGSVYQGWDTSLQRAVAIKVLHRTSKDNQLQKWLDEARTVAALDHPAIVPVYDVGQTVEGCGYMVSKLIDGGSLNDHKETNSLDFVATVGIVARIAAALDYAHRQKIVHRDVKPANILISSTGEAALSDFGLALHESEFGAGARFVGTPSYMSPEQARHEGHRVDGRSDIYSVGVVLYELLVGVRPFRAATPDELLDCIRNVEVRPLRQINRSVPRELERICLKSLSKRAADRHTTAGDLSEDLLNWISERQVTVATDSQGSTGNASHQGSGSQSLETVSVVPRGLRPFDAADSDFFLHLVPGAKDREGVPECVRFWRSLIDEQNEDSTFRVGVLLGPSGSGKSSLVRAGIVPRLDPSVITIRVEARPEGLERHLLHRLKSTLPELKQANSLPEAMAWIRGRRGIAQDAKLLVVIDQFEQWLNHNDSTREHELLEALRQCDGATLQTLLLVRDDFMLPVAEFMDALEEPLLQNHNFATVDLFGAEHTQEVLTAFGRAYSTIDDPPTTEQRHFLDAAVKELSSNGRVVPVHLALFADMIKDKSWTPAALRGLGGTRGVGMAFLEERLSGAGANPFFLSHAESVRRLLGELLPPDDSAIKPPARTLAELTDRLRDPSSSQWLERLLGLLDTEVRLVTPSGRVAGSPDSSGSASESGSLTSSREPRYQLTHDYLVPSIRSWLAFEERRTRSGRSRARLRELAHAWDVKPEARRLPSVWEWLSISGLTSASAWSETERRMMNAACRRLAWIAAILVFVGGSTWFVGRKVESRFRAASLAQRLVNADTAEVASILQEARPYDAEFKDALNRREHDDSEPRHKLNTSLAFVHSDRSRWDYLLDHLDDIRIEHLGHIRELTIGRNNGLQEKAWSRLDAAETNREKLLLSSLLAEVSPEDERWQQHRAALVQAVMQARPDHFSQFVEFLAPLRLQLSEELLTRLRRPENSRTEIQRHQLVEMSAVYVGVEPSTQFVEAVSAVTAGELPSFTARITGESNVRTELRRHFAELHNQLHPRNTPLEKTRQLTTLEQRLESLGGFLDGRGGLAQAVPREDFESLTQSLAAANYEPVCVRPFSDSGQPLVAGVWQRGNAQWKIHWELDPAEAKTLNDKLVVQGFLMRDMAWSSTVAGQRRLSVLWIKPSDAALKTNQETFIDITLTELLAASRELGVGWGVERFAVHHWPESETRCCAILRRVKSPDEASVAIRMRCAFGDVSPGLLRTDVRFAWLDPSQPDRTLLHLAAAEFEDRAVRSSGSSAETAQLSAINYLSAANQLGTAEQRLAALASEKSDSVRWRTYSAYSAARSRDLERLEGDIDWFQRKGRTSSSGAFRLQAAALRGDLSRVEKLFETEREASKTSDTRFVQFLQALGTVAGMEELGEIGNQVTAEFNRGAREVIEERRRRDPALLFSYVDFDGARSTPEFQTLMREKQMDQCYTTAAYPDARYESRILFGLSSADHRSRVETLRRGGFLPVSICASTDPKTGEHQVCSSWRRAVVPAGAQARISRSLGNVALVLASLGESDLLMDGLNDRFGRDVRSYLTLHSPVLLPSSELVQALRVSRSSHERRAIVQTLGSFYVDELSEVDLEYATLQLQGLASTAADAGLRNSSVWALKSWGIPAGDAPAQSDQPSKTNNWFVNSVGQTMIIVRPPETFVMGSPAWEAGHQLDMDEYLHHAQLGHDFAMSATEVSVNQFEAFWNDPKVKQFYGDRRFDYNQSRAPEPDCPQIEVSWLHAARFCQWLSEREGIPKEQWCYPGVWDPDAKSIALPDDYRLRRGYRLPAQMEWEFAAHRGSSLTRYCGSDTQLLSGFEWTKENSGEISHVVGTLRPNDDGFWDLLGNVSEWCDDPRQRLYLPRDGFIHHFETGPQSRFPDAKVEMTARGGRYGWSTTSARAAERHYYAAGHDSVEIGFRVVKTVSESQ